MNNKNFLSKNLQCSICSNQENLFFIICSEYKTKKPTYVLSSKKECGKFKSNNILNTKSVDKELNLVVSGIFRFVVADALGVPLEFSSREDRKKDMVKEMRAYGTHTQFFGTWSDDSSLTLCLLDSLSKGYDINDISKKFISYSYNSLWTPYEEVFDIGNTTYTAINKMKQNIEPIKCGGTEQNDNGNGSLMRVLPLAFFLKNETSIDRKINIIENISSLTHAHKISKLACIIYVEIAINLLKGKSKSDAIDEALKFILTNCSNEYKETLHYFTNIFNKNLYLFEENKISSSGYVVDTLESSLWCFLTTNDYSSAIFKAINLGGDTDTIAAITGGLAGIFYGIDNIPNNWIQCLAKKEEIYNCILNFYNYISEKFL